MTQVTGDWTNEVYTAQRTGTPFNGFVTPFFDKAEANRVVAHHAQMVADTPDLAEDLGEFVWAYDGTLIYLHTDGKAKRQALTIYPESFGEEKLYDFGLLGWTWVELEEEDDTIGSALDAVLAQMEDLTYKEKIAVLAATLAAL